MDTISPIPNWNACFNLLLDPEVSEIESNGPGQYFMKKGGARLPVENLPSESSDQYLKGVEQGLIPLVKSIYEYKPNAFLFEGPIEFTGKDGTEVKGRCHIVLPPASPHPQVTIAKKSRTLATVDSIAERGSMAEEMLLFLKDCIKSNMTMAISGPTGAGKTTMLEALSKLIPDHYRIGVAEDSPELELIQNNVSYTNSVPWKPGIRETDVATLSWVVQQYQRMRTDKIIIGETRGKEFADFLVAANSGMEGSLTTIHADTAQRCLNKMTNFAMRGSGNVPIRAINQDIANSIDIIIQLAILPNGSHKVRSITEVTSTIGNTESAEITTSNLYSYDEVKNEFIKTGYISDSMRARFADKGISLDKYNQTPMNDVLRLIDRAQHTDDRSRGRSGRTIGEGSGLPTMPRSRNL